jgi:hypothetical protein
MSEEGLPKLIEPKPEDFIVIPDLNIAITKDKARTVYGTLTNISWWNTKLLIQSLGSNYFLPTSAQWSKAMEYLEENYPKLRRSFVTVVDEWVDSLLALPYKGKYSSKLQIPGIEEKKVPLLIEQSKVERRGGDYVVTEGKVREVPELPLKPGYIQAWDEDLGLPTKVGGIPNEKFGGAYFMFLEGELRALSYDGGLYLFMRPPHVVGGFSFRLARGLSDDEKFVRIPRAEYRRLLKLSKELNELLSRVRV